MGFYVLITRDGLLKQIAAPMDLITLKVDHMAACSSTRTFLSVLPRDLAVYEPCVELRCNGYFSQNRLVGTLAKQRKLVRNLDAFDVALQETENHYHQQSSGDWALESSASPGVQSICIYCITGW